MPQKERLLQGKYLIFDWGRNSRLFSKPPPSASRPPLRRFVSVVYQLFANKSAGHLLATALARLELLASSALPRSQRDRML